MLSSTHSRYQGLEMNADTVNVNRSNQMLAACDGARRSMFAAATRVIQYHQSTLDQKVNRLLRAELTSHTVQGVRINRSVDNAVEAVTAP